MRGPGLAVGIALLCAPAALADEPPTRASIAAEDWALLPINDLEKQELARDHADLVRKVTSLVARIKKVAAKRATRENPDDDGGRRLGAHAASLREQLSPLLDAAIAALDDDAIDQPLLGHIAAAPAGPLRVGRYAAGIPLFVDGWTGEGRALIEYVVPRLEGALLALDGERENHRRFAAKHEIDDVKQQAWNAASAQRLRGIEKRYWRLIDYVVPESARAAIHRRLPSAYQRIETVLQHVYALPGLTASQGTRVRALLEEIQAQAAPDSALMKRLQGRGGSAEDRRAAQTQLREAQHRIMALQRWAVTESRRVLSKAQWTALEAIPPRVSLADRKQTSPQILAGVDLTSTQRQKLTTMRESLGAYRRAYSERRLKAGARMAGMGPDSPQRARAEMAMANVVADGNVVQRRFNGRVFLELLTPAQVVRWVLGTGKAR